MDILGGRNLWILMLFVGLAQGATILNLPGASFEHGWGTQSISSLVFRDSSNAEGFTQLNDVHGDLAAQGPDPLTIPVAHSSSDNQSPLISPYAAASAEVNGEFLLSGNGSVGAQASTFAGHASLTPELNPTFGQGSAQVFAWMKIPLAIFPASGEASANFVLNYDVLVDSNDILGIFPGGGAILDDTEREILLTGNTFQSGVASAAPSPLTGSFTVSNIPFGSFYELSIFTRSEAFSQSSMTFTPDPTDPLRFIISDISGPDGDLSFASIYFNFHVTGNVSPPNPVPEPSTWLLVGSGLAGLAAWRRKRAKAIR